MAGRQGFWDVEERLKELSAQGDPLETLAATVDFEMFRADLARRSGGATAEGRPAGFDPVLKFRMLVLQAMHGLSLEQTEYLVRRPAELDAVLRAWSRRCRPRRQHAVGLPRGADRGRRAGGAVRAARPGDQRGGLSADVGADRRRDAGGRPAPAQTGGEKARSRTASRRARSGRTSQPRRGRRTPTRRWTIKFSKAKPAADGSAQVDIAVPAFGYKCHISIDRRHGIIRRQHGDRRGRP